MAAPKKYTDFPAGIYDTTKIFLQADPVTGSLEKVNLPSIGGSSQFFKTPTGNSAGVMSDLVTIPIPANTLSSPGQSFQITSYLFTSGITTANPIVINYGLSTINIATIASTIQYIISMRFVYASAGNCHIFGSTMRSTSILATGGGLLSAFNSTVDNNIIIQTNNPNANVVQHKLSILELSL